MLHRPGSVLEAGRQAESPLGHRLRDQRLHPVDLSAGCRPARVLPEDHPTYRVVSGQLNRVGPDAVLDVACPLLLDRPGGVPVRIDDDRRDSLGDEIRRGAPHRIGMSEPRVLVPVVRMTVNVDEAGSDDQSARIHSTYGCRSREIPDRHDPVAADANVRPHGGIAGAVDDPAVLNQHVIGRCRLLTRGCSAIAVGHPQAEEDRAGHAHAEGTQAKAHCRITTGLPPAARSRSFKGPSSRVVSFSR